MQECILQQARVGPLPGQSSETQRLLQNCSAGLEFTWWAVGLSSQFRMYWFLARLGMQVVLLCQWKQDLSFLALPISMWSLSAR